MRWDEMKIEEMAAARGRTKKNPLCDSIHDNDALKQPVYILVHHQLFI